MKFKDFIINDKNANSFMNEASTDKNGFLKAMQASATFKEIKKICNKYGYDLTFAYPTLTGIRHDIEPKSKSRYEPRFYMMIENPRSDKVTFSIQTTSYGALDVNEPEAWEFLEKFSNCANMLKELSKVDFSKLPKIEDFQTA